VRAPVDPSKGMLVSSGYGARVVDKTVAASAAAASASHHDLSPSGLAAAACSAAAAASEVTTAQVNTLAQKEGLVLVKARNETGFEGVRFRPAACALLCKPFKARYEAGKQIEHLGYFSSPAEGALAYARRVGPAACKAAAAAAKRAAPPGGETEAAPKKKRQKQKAGAQKTDASEERCCDVGTSSNASRAGVGARSGAPPAGGVAGGGAAGGRAARLAAGEKSAAPALQPAERESAEEAAKAAADAKLRAQLMAAIVHARACATLSGASPPTAKELHAAVCEPLHALPPTTLAAVKKCMSLLVAMQRAGVPHPAAGET